MIKVDISKDKIIVDGHSLYDEYGKDIVCASVSTLVIASVNLMLRFDKEAIKYIDSDGYLEIDILKHSREIDIIISNMTDLLKQLEEQYKNNIKIK